MEFDTGDVGEDTLRLWASRAGITANRVERDKHAWDFCLQIRRSDREPPSALPLDQRPPELMAMVQVKTTAVGDDSATISLGNWERMVKDPLPWFVLGLSLDAAGDVKGAHLVHIDEMWITKVLRRLRELTEEGPAGPAKHTMDISFAAGDILRPPFHDELRAKLEQRVGTLSQYMQNKLRLMQQVGYDRGRYEVTVTRKIEDAELDRRLLVDFAIGLVKKLPINSLSVRDVRFSTPHVVEDRPILDGYMELAAVPSVGTTRVIFSNSTRRVALTCQTFVPTVLFPDLPPDLFKVRFSAAGVTIVATNDLSMNLSWQLPEPASKVPLADLEVMANLLTLLAEADTVDRLIVSYEAEGKLFKLATASKNGSVSAEQKEFCSIVECAAAIARRFSLPTDLQVSPDELLREESRLPVLRELLEGGQHTTNVSVVVLTDDNLQGKPTTLFVPASTRIGADVVGAIFAMSGKAECSPGEDRISISGAKVTLLESFVVPVAEWSTFDRRKESARIAGNYKGADDEVIIIPPEVDETDGGED